MKKQELKRLQVPFNVYNSNGIKETVIGFTGFMEMRLPCIHMKNGKTILLENFLSQYNRKE